MMILIKIDAESVYRKWNVMITVVIRLQSSQQYECSQPPVQ